MSQSQSQSEGLRPNNLAYLHRDRGYRFEDRDPDMEHLCNLIHKSHLSVQGIVERVKKKSNGSVSISPTTIDNWLSGKTRRPQNFTMTWVASAIGYERKWRRI